MKQFVCLLLSLFIALSQAVNLKSEENIIQYELHSEFKQRAVYRIQTNLTYRIIQANEYFIYFLEPDEGLELQDKKNQTFKELAVLSSLNDSFMIYPTEEIGNEKIIYIISISNEGVEASMIKDSNFYFSTIMRQNLIKLIHVESEEQIISLNSLDSVTFSYWKYENLNYPNPSAIYPVNRTLFSRYNGNVLTLQKNSVYVFVAEIYKLDSAINSIEIFSSPCQVSKEIDLQFNLLYLKTAKDPYKINFREINLTRIFKLSNKTNESNITLNGGYVLNSENPYYELSEEDIKNGIQLKVENGDGLIEVLFSSKNDSEILDSFSIKNHKLTKTYTIIKIPKNRCIYDFYLSSKNKNKLKLLNVGYNHKISKDDYFYNWFNISKKYDDEKGINIILTSPYLYRTKIDKDEYQILEIVLEKEQLDNDIYLSYNPTYYFEYLLKEIDEKKSEYIIGNMSLLLDKYYVYKDIAKKPPEVENLTDYHHKPIDMIASLKAISTKNQTYLSLYQDIFKVLKSVRDNHLSIRLNKIEDFSVVSAELCFPFELYIGNESNVPVVKIRAYQECLDLSEYKEPISKFIEEHIDIPLKSINGTSPFDFIQNFYILQKYRSKHAHFTINLDAISHFSIRGIPYGLSDLIDIEYEFENGDIINLNYVLMTLSNLRGINLKEFEEFYNSLINNQPNPMLIPNLFKAKKLFLKKKGVLLKETPNKIQWDYQTKDGQLKCRKDNELGYNVFVQSSFNFDSK